MVWGEPWVNGPGWARFCSHGRGCSIGPLRPSIGGWMSIEYGVWSTGCGGGGGGAWAGEEGSR